jgi:hypothetical protein
MGIMVGAGAERIADRARPHSLLRLATDAQIAKDASAITAARGNVILAARQAVDGLNHLAWQALRRDVANSIFGHCTPS